MSPDTIVEQYIYGRRPETEKPAEKELARSAGVDNAMARMVANYVSVFDDIPQERFGAAVSIIQFVHDQSDNLIILRAWITGAGGRAGRLTKSLILPSSSYDSIDPIATALAIGPQIPAEPQVSQLSLSELSEQTKPFTIDYSALLENEYVRKIVRTVMEEKTLSNDLPVILEVDFDLKLSAQIAGLLYFSLPYPNRRKGFITVYGVEPHKILSANKDYERMNRDSVYKRLMQYDFIFVHKYDYDNLRTSVLPRIAPVDTSDRQNDRHNIGVSLDILFKLCRSTTSLWSILKRIRDSKKSLSQMYADTFEKHFLKYALLNSDINVATDIIRSYAATRKTIANILDGDITRIITQYNKIADQPQVNNLIRTILEQNKNRSDYSFALEPWLWDLYFQIIPGHPAEKVILEEIGKMT